jgi:hypothetical protein
METTEKNIEQFQAPTLAPQEGERKLKVQSQGKPESPGNRLAIPAKG